MPAIAQKSSVIGMTGMQPVEKVLPRAVACPSLRCDLEDEGMMGHKERAFGPLAAVSLDDLVPADHFYRHLERTLDLAFVRELVRDCYAAGGRPSVDPLVFFKLQLVMFFEGLRSERQLMRVVDRKSTR